MLVIRLLSPNGTYFGCGRRISRLPCIPRIGDHICLDSDDCEGTEVEEVRLVVNDKLPVVCLSERCRDKEDQEFAKGWWKNHGYSFD